MIKIQEDSITEINSQKFAKTTDKSSTKNEKKNNNNNKKNNVMKFIFINILQNIIIFNSILALQEAILFKDGNFTVHSFLNTFPITRIEDNNTRLLHDIKSDIGSILSRIKRESRREIFLKTINDIQQHRYCSGRERYISKHWLLF
jgi:hypothetical protein